MNKRLFFSISLVLVLCLASNASAGFVAYWNFDDSTADDVVGGHHGTLVSDPGPNTVTFVFDAVMDSNVAYFPGDPNCWINCGGGKAAPNDPCTWADIQGDTITIAAWVKVDGAWPALPKYQYVFAKEPSYRVSRYSAQRNIRLYLEDGPDGSLGGTLGGVDMDVDDGQWHHIGCVYDGTTKIIYLDGNINATESASGRLKTDATYDVTIGGDDNYVVRTWKGWIDDVRLYDSAEAQWRIKLLAGNYTAYAPVPVDGAPTEEASLAQLSWAGMPGTYDYRVYLGTDEMLVTNGDASVNKGEVDVPDYNGAPMGALAYDATYYWRVDSNSGVVGMVEGLVWQFVTKPAWTKDPIPYDGCKYWGLSEGLKWSGGADAIKHEVFLGTNEAWVTDVCDVLDATHVATIVAPDPCACSPALVTDTTYYWKVDSNAGTLYTEGQVWSFSTEATSPEPNLIGYWPLDVIEGDVTWDISGKAHHGTLVEDPGPNEVTIVYDAERGGNVGVFPGPNAMINCGGGLADPWADGMEQITISCWVQIEQYTAKYQYIAAKEGAWRIMRYSDLDLPRFYTNGSPSTLLGTTDLQGGDWHHFVGVSDGTTKYIYIDGRMEGSITRERDIYDSTYNIIIGGTERADSQDRMWKGLIDDVKIYDIAVPCWKIVAEGTQCGTCVGDLDANSVVDLTDLNILIGDLTWAKLSTGWNQWLITENDPCDGALWKNCADMDADDDIDLADLNRMVGNLTWEKIMVGNWFYPAGTYCP